jgi:hypothetical protein
MTSWIDKVLSDTALTNGAKRLADVVSKNFAANNARYAAFYDTEPAKVLETTREAVRIARHELMRAGYLVELQHGTGRPSYTLRVGGYVASEVA